MYISCRLFNLLDRLEGSEQRVRDLVGVNMRWVQSVHISGRGRNLTEKQQVRDLV